MHEPLNIHLTVRACSTPRARCQDTNAFTCVWPNLARREVEGAYMIACKSALELLLQKNPWEHRMMYQPARYSSSHEKKQAKGDIADCDASWV